MVGGAGLCHSNSILEGESERMLVLLRLSGISHIRRVVWVEEIRDSIWEDVFKKVDLIAIFIESA
jgi:hypothetical protein